MLSRLLAVLAAATLVRAIPAQEHGTTTLNGFEVVIVYATAEGCPATPTGCAAPGLHEEKPTIKATPTATFTSTAPVATLRPNTHWDCDTKPIKNIVPIAPEDGSKMYYGINNPSKAGEFAWMTYYFNRPSVNLDHTDHIIDIEYTPNGLEMSFDSAEAWDYAIDTWDDDMMLITFTEGCGAFEKLDRCFFHVASITWNKDRRSIIAKGKPAHPDDVISKGESEWGYYTPRESGKRPGKKPSASNSGACIAPVDEKYGLPTACFGHSFDRDLDAMYKPQDMSDEYQDFVDSIYPDLAKRGFFGFIGKVVDVVTKPIQVIADAALDLLAVSADIDKDFTFALPGNGSELGAGLVHTTSPWGDAIQLFKEEMPSSNGLSGHVNVYCVGCSVNGHAKLFGKAKWVPFKGIEEGFIEVNADLQLGLKLGIDAAVQFTHTKHFDLFSMGLPGLSFGVISIGPRIDVGANVGLEASAEGKLLAGAEMGLQNAVARLDFKDKDKTDVSGFNPNFVPVFEAEGRIKASASLGLPVGIHIGIKIAMFDLSAGIVDEPSIKATAEVAGKVSLVDGDLEGGITETNGCKGISGQLSWRNKLDLKASFFKDKNILDTNDQLLTEVCIPIGNQDKPAPPAIDPPATEPPATVPELPAPAHEVPAEPPVEPPANFPADPVPPVDAPPAEPPLDTHPAEEVPTPEFPVETAVETPTETPVETPAGTPVDTPVEPAETPIKTPVQVTPVPNLPSGAPKPSGKPTLTSAKPSARPTSVKPSITVETSAKPTATSEPHEPFRNEDGLEFASLLSSSSKVAACSNGNMYVVSKDGKNTPSCSDLWAFKEDALVADGTSRALHYYNNTMAILGISRLRIDHESRTPEGGVLIAWAPDVKNKMYIAVDPDDNFFYPIACAYENGNAKVFLAKDPEEGVKTLKSKDVQYSITGGKVKDCTPLKLVKGASLSYGTYGSA
ncbi:hypothetical protein HJFPF1_04573 [Paramyrothecium foliicola]|nr:hypothetical protein HJFPF1_04573 [Paramyrothecium foliicola]